MILSLWSDLQGFGLTKQAKQAACYIKPMKGNDMSCDSPDGNLHMRITWLLMQIKIYPTPFPFADGWQQTHAQEASRVLLHNDKIC